MEKGRHAPCGMGCRAWEGPVAGRMDGIEKWQWGTTQRGLCKEADWKRMLGRHREPSLSSIRKAEPCVMLGE